MLLVFYLRMRERLLVTDAQVAVRRRAGPTASARRDRKRMPATVGTTGHFFVSLRLNASAAFAIELFSIPIIYQGGVRQPLQSQNTCR